MKKASKATKATRKAARKPATAAKKPGKAKTPVKVKTPPKATETPKAATFTPVTLPVKITSQNGIELEVTAKSIKITHGLHEVIFAPAQAWIVREDVSESNGRKLPYTVKAGSVVLRRGDFCVTFGPDKTDAINAILTAREIAKAAAKAAKEAAKAEKKGGAK